MAARGDVTSTCSTFLIFLSNIVFNLFFCASYVYVLQELDGEFIPMSGDNSGENFHETNKQFEDMNFGYNPQDTMPPWVRLVCGC